jgi:hypothetical protein
MLSAAASSAGRAVLRPLDGALDADLPRNVIGCGAVVGEDGTGEKNERPSAEPDSESHCSLPSQHGWPIIQMTRFSSKPLELRAPERLSLTEGGLVRCALRTPYRDGTTHVIFEPEDFMARLVALVPTRSLGVSTALRRRALLNLYSEIGLSNDAPEYSLAFAVPMRLR